MAFAKLSGSLLASNDAQPRRAPAEAGLPPDGTSEARSRLAPEQGMLDEAVTNAIEVARLYDELRDCFGNNDQEGAKRVFAQLDRAPRPLVEILGVVKSFAGVEGGEECPANGSGTAPHQIAAPASLESIAGPRQARIADAVGRGLSSAALESAATAPVFPPTHPFPADRAPLSSAEPKAEPGGGPAASHLWEPWREPGIALAKSDTSETVGEPEAAGGFFAEKSRALASETSLDENALELTLANLNSGRELSVTAEALPKAALAAEEPQSGRRADLLPISSDNRSDRRRAVLRLHGAVVCSALIAVLAAAACGVLLLRGGGETGSRVEAARTRITAELSSPEGTVAKVPVSTAVAAPPAQETAAPEVVAAWATASSPDYPEQRDPNRSDAMLMPTIPLPPPTGPALMAPLPASSPPAPRQAPEMPVASVLSPHPPVPIMASTTQEPAPNGPVVHPTNPNPAPARSEIADKPAALVALLPKELVPAQETPPAAANGTASGAGRSEPRVDGLRFLDQGDRLFVTGNLASARLFYERAANEGSGQAALRLGETYDPAFLKRIQWLRSVQGDAEVAMSWYRRARELGASDADILLQSMQAK